MTAKTKVLICAPVRQDHQTFYKYLKALNRLEKNNVQVDLFFILHNSPRLARFLKPEQYTFYKSDNEYVRDQQTHHWTNDNLRDVTIMKNGLIRYALEKRYDYMFLVDSDLILKPETLMILLSHKKDICAEVFWTKWTPDGEEQPNAWSADFYSFAGHEIEQWKQAGLYQVGMSGACILIKSNVLKSGVNYSPIYNVSHSLWEDRAFCIRAAVAGFKIYLDTSCAPEHLYRQKPVKPESNKKKQEHLRK